jgi:hypothetical protein
MYHRYPGLVLQKQRRQRNACSYPRSQAEHVSCGHGHHGRPEKRGLHDAYEYDNNEVGFDTTTRNDIPRGDNTRLTARHNIVVLCWADRNSRSCREQT